MLHIYRDFAEGNGYTVSFYGIQLLDLVAFFIVDERSIPQRHDVCIRDLRRIVNDPAIGADPQTDPAYDNRYDQKQKNTQNKDTDTVARPRSRRLQFFSFPVNTRSSIIHIFLFSLSKKDPSDPAVS